MVIDSDLGANVRATTGDIVVSAWVPTSGAPERVPARVVAWTDHTVEVEWPLDDVVRQRAWVWKGAISAP